MTIKKIIAQLLVLFLVSFSMLAQAKISNSILSQLNIASTIPGKIKLNAPDIAENGSTVSITIDSIAVDDDNVFVESVYIFSSLRKKAVAHFKLGKAVIPENIQTRIKLGKTATVSVLAMLSDGRVLSAKKQIKVTIGGCGGGYYPGSQSSAWHPQFQNISVPAQNRERYATLNDNPLKQVSQSPVSTFSVDVDTGSYSNVRRFIMKEGILPVTNAVRTEELVNYFSYNYPIPDTKNVPFTLNSEIAPTPWNRHTRLLHIGLKGYDVPSSNLPAANLVFLIDVSGSMNSPDKIGLLKASMRLVTSRLRAIDRVSMVVYAGASGVVLEPTTGAHRHKILAALNSLSAGGSTNGGAGIQLAYAKAREAFIPGGINRVIIATDGDFNVGTVNQTALIDLVKQQRSSGIGLTALGFGRGNYNEHLMEQLADNGDGNYAYIDNLSEARKVLVEELSATLFTIARDVKIQVEFNPEIVAEYRLIGYENRMLKREDFNNDKVDAGDIGAGHTVTAIYEVTLHDSKARHVDALRYQPEVVKTKYTGEIAQIKLRYKEKQGDASKLITQLVNTEDVMTDLSQSSDRFRFSAAVAAYGQLLKNSEYTGGFSYNNVKQLAATALGNDNQGNRKDFIEMVDLTQSLQLPTVIQ